MNREMLDLLKSASHFFFKQKQEEDLRAGI